MKKKLGIGIVGLGRIFPRHLDDAIKQLSELELVAVCDVRKKIVDQLAKKEKVKGYTDFKKLIDDPRVDVVSVCTPNIFHFPIGLYVAKKNKHCVMEKPVAMTYKESKKIVDAFQKSKGILFPVLQVRFNPSVQALYQAVKDNYLGKIFSASLIIRWTRPQAYFDKSVWKGTIKMDGGSLLTQGIHYIDVMQYVLGHAKSVFGKMSKAIHKIEVEDTAWAIVDFKSGARANIEFTINTYPHNLECSLTVLGEKGSIKIGGVAMDKIEIWEVANMPQPKINGGIQLNTTTFKIGVGSSPNHKAIYQNLVDVLIYEKKSFLKGTDTLESMRIIDGIKKSSKLKREINL